MSKHNILQSVKRKALFRRVAKQVDIEVLLAIIGINYEDRSNELYAICPNPEHLDEDPSWSINNKEGHKSFGLHSCWSCGFAGDFIQLTATIMSTEDDRWTYEDATNWIIEKVCNGEALDEDAFYDMALESKLHDIDEEDNEPMDVISLPREFKLLRTKNQFFEYATSREITPIQLVKYGIGFAVRGKYQNRLIIPFKLNGEIVSFFARSILKNIPKKFRGLYPPGPKMNKLIWPYDDVDPSLGYIICVEGPIDVLRLKALGFKNVVCLFGAKISDYQVIVIDILFAQYKIDTGKTPVINLMPDADGEIKITSKKALYTKGKLMLKHAEEKLKYKYRVYVIDLPDGEDPGSASPDDIFNAFSNKRTLSSEGNIIIKVNYSIKNSF